MSTLAKATAMMKLTLVSVLLLAVTAAAASSRDDCDRGCLIRIADNYLNALTHGDVEQIRSSLSSENVMTENGDVTSPGKGLWSTAKGFATRQTFADPTSGQVALFAEVREDGGLYAHVAIRLKVAERKITEIETMAVRHGDHSLFDPNPPPPMLPLWSTPVALSSVQKRDELIALANDYYETLLRSDPRGLFSPDCDRFENGVQTSNNPQARGGISCTEGGKGYYGFIKGARSRRFPVVDEELGIVVGMAHLDLPGTVKELVIRGKSIPIPERNQVQRSSAVFAVYKVQYGQIRAIMARVREEPYLHATVWDKQ